MHLGGAVITWASGQSLPRVWVAGVGEALTLPCQGCLSQKQSLKLCLFQMTPVMTWEPSGFRASLCLVGAV